MKKSESITTLGYLFQHAFNKDEPETLELLQTMSMRDAVSRAEQLCLLFRFANTGQLGPLYIEGKSISANPLSENAVVAMAMVWQTTPIEQLGYSWINTDSDLASYLGCFPALERMLKTPHWEETLYSILTWYEQAM